MQIHFVVPGKPFGKQRPRFSTRGLYTRAYTPGETISYEKLVREYALDEARFRKFDDDDPLYVKVEAYFSIPQSASKRKQEQMRLNILKPRIKPDADNILKIILDPLNEVLFKDDKNVIEARVIKKYSDNPRVEVTIANSTIDD